MVMKKLTSSFTQSKLPKCIEWQMRNRTSHSGDNLSDQNVAKPMPPIERASSGEKELFINVHIDRHLETVFFKHYPADSHASTNSFRYIAGY